MTVLEQLENHSLYSTINSYFTALRTVEQDEEFIATLDNYGSQTLHRCNVLLHQIQARLDLIDPFLARKATLDAIHTEYSNINSIITNYKTHFNNVNNLNTVNSRIDNVLAHLISLYYLADSESVDGIRDAVVSFRRTIGQHKRILEVQQKQLAQKNTEVIQRAESLEPLVNQLNETFDSAYSNFNTKLSDQQSEFSSSEETRSSKFEEKLNYFQETFQESLQTLKEEWNQNAQEIQETMLTTISEMKDQQQRFIDETKAKQLEYDEILEEHKKSVELLVGNISTTSISGHFKEVADKKEKNVTLWHRLTVGGFAATIGFGVYAFIFSAGTEWTSLIAKLIVTAAIGSFTAYAARQVTKNEEQEKYNRQMEVELKTLNPYIAAFEDTDQIKLKGQLFPLIFGRAEVSQQATNKTLNSPSNQLGPEDMTALSSVIEVLKNLTSGPNRPA